MVAAFVTPFPGAGRGPAGNVFVEERNAHLLPARSWTPVCAGEGVLRQDSRA
jgi:hypothetical protein